MTKKYDSLSEAQNENISNIIDIIAKKLRYDESYNFTDPGSEETDFDKFRTDLANALRMVSKLNPTYIGRFVEQLVMSMPDIRDPLSLEVVVHLVYQLGDGVPDDQLKQLMPRLLRLLTESRMYFIAREN